MMIRKTVVLFACLGCRGSGKRWRSGCWRGKLKEVMGKNKQRERESSTRRREEMDMKGKDDVSIRRGEEHGRE